MERRLDTQLLILPLLLLLLLLLPPPPRLLRTYAERDAKSAGVSIISYNTPGTWYVCTDIALPVVCLYASS